MRASTNDRRRRSRSRALLRFLEGGCRQDVAFRLREILALYVLKYGQPDGIYPGSDAENCGFTRAAVSADSAPSHPARTPLLTAPPGKIWPEGRAGTEEGDRSSANNDAYRMRLGCCGATASLFDRSGTVT